MRKAATAALAAVLMQGCFASKPAPAPAPGLPSVEQLLDALEQRRADLIGVRAMARLRYRSPERSDSARNVLAVERPDRIRFEVVSMLGALLVLTSDDGRFAAYVPSESTVYRGAASAQNLAAYLPIDVSVERIVDLLLATPQMAENLPAAVDWEEGLVRITQRDANGARATCFTSDLTPARYREIDPQGRITLDARYEDIDATSRIPLARQLTVHLPLTSELLVISMKDPEINPDLPAGFFSVSPPGDTREVDLDGSRL